MKYYLFFLLLVSASWCNAQYYTLDAQRLYVGVKNPITIRTLNKTNLSESVLRVRGANIYPNPIAHDRSELHYFIEVDTPGHYQMSLVLHNKTLILDTLKAVHLPPASAYFSGYTSGKIQSTIIRAQIGLTAGLKDFDYDTPRFDIISFTFIKVGADGTKTDLRNSGAIFNEQIKKLIDQTKHGDMYLFTDVVLKTRDGYSYKGNNIVVTAE